MALNDVWDTWQTGSSNANFVKTFVAGVSTSDSSAKSRAETEAEWLRRRVAEVCWRP